MTGLSPDTGTVLCDDISIVFIRIRRYEILWTWCRVWESHSDTHVGYRRLPTVPDNNRGVATVIGGFPGVAEPPRVEPVVPVATVRTALPEEPTVLEVLAQNILDQTVNCGEKRRSQDPVD